MISLPRLPFLLIVIPLLGSAATSAGEFEYSLNGGIGQTNNIDRVSTARQSATLANLGTEFSLLEESRTLSADVAGDLAYYHYSGGTYSDQVLGNVRTALAVHIFQDRLSWVVDDNFGQTRRDLVSTLSPNNIENVNYFSTGPLLRLDFSPALRVALQGSYKLVDYERSPFDSLRYGAQLSIVHPISTSSAASFRISTEHVEPRSSATFQGYSRQEAVARYELTGARTTFEADAGVGRVTHPTGDTTGPVIRWNIRRGITSHSTLFVEGGREYTDPGNALGTDRGPGRVTALETNSFSQTADTYINTYVRAGWRVEGRLTQLSLSTGYSQEDYSSVTQPDRKRYDLRVEVGRQFGPQLSGRVDYSYSRDQLNLGTYTPHESYFEAAVEWRLARSLWLDVSGETYRFTTPPSGVQGSELRGWLRLRYGAKRVRQVGEAANRVVPAPAP